MTIATVILMSVVASGCMGRWVTDPVQQPSRGTHAALLHTGKVLLVAGSGNDPAAFAAGSFKTSVWDPVNDSYQDIPTPTDLFCGGHAFLSDGRVLVNGGTSSYGSATNSNLTGRKDTYIFDPQTQQYNRASDMGLARWYPTVTELGNGNLFTAGGFDENGKRTSASEIFNGSSWGSLIPLPQAMIDMPLYPSLHLMDDGRLFYSGAQAFSGVRTPPGIWNLGTNQFTPVSGLPDPTRRDQGMSVLLPPAQKQKVMIIGGGNQFDTTNAPTASTGIIDLSQPNPAYVTGPPISAPKMYVSAVILPDSTVLQTGGGESVFGGKTPSMTAQIYHPDTNTWSDVAAPNVARLYHSSAILLPDATVATFGSNIPSQNSFDFHIERFTPPYLSTGSARPAITSAPTEVTYGGQYSISTTAASPLRSLALVRPMAVTHSLEPNQRLVDIPFTPSGGGTAITMPSSHNDAPPGWYMLFAVDSNGVPSVASWMHLT